MQTIGERLRYERERLGLSQTAMGDIGSVRKLAQINYEKGESFPNAAYLAAIAAAGADVLYIVTGERDGPPPLKPEEHLLLERYRASPPPLRDAALRVLLGGEPAPKAAARKQEFVFHGDVSGGVHKIKGDYHETRTINSGEPKKK